MRQRTAAAVSPFIPQEIILNAVISTVKRNSLIVSKLVEDVPLGKGD
jgi:hypothetical protein